MEQTKTLIKAQLGVAGLIFVLFTIAFFITKAYILTYILIPLIAINIALLYINKTKGIPFNISLFFLALLLRVFIVEYIAAILGMVISGIHGLTMWLQYTRGGEAKKAEAKPKKKAVSK